MEYKYCQHCGKKLNADSVETNNSDECQKGGKHLWVRNENSTAANIYTCRKCGKIDFRTPHTLQIR